MVFKRRNKRTWKTVIWESIYPKGGWTRAFGYVGKRLQRLPGTPEFIARGIWAGVFASFSPFYGIHLLVAAFVAYLIRGNILASLMGTFFGNPLTYVPIAVSSLTTGHFILGNDRPNLAQVSGLGRVFLDAGGDLWRNLVSLFFGGPRDWAGLLRFWEEVFLPYMVGFIFPGAVTATVVYFISVPLIRAYQNRRRGRLRAKLAELKEKAVATAKRDGSQTGD